MDKEFSEGFMHDIADLLTICTENNTDNMELEFDVAGKTLNVSITFSIQ